MSHFPVVVSVPRLPADEMNSKVDELLAPYDENMDVPEYPRECYCISGEAKMHGRKMADKLVGSWGDRKETFRDLPDYVAARAEMATAAAAEDWDTYHRISDEQDARWSAWNADFAQDYETTKREYTEGHALFGKADPECDTCNGAGTYASEYNPASKWDWYRVGGRFDGLITQNPQESENGFNFDPKHETLANNSVPVSELIATFEQAGETFIPYALVTEADGWIERGSMGWWGMSSGDKNKDAWAAEVVGIYKKYADMDAVLLDCHI
jgi:hypothetical protein